MNEALCACRDGKALAIELRRIVDAILAGEIRTQADLESHKKDVSSLLGLSSLPSNADILGFASPEERERLKIAREIHDTILQFLLVLTYGLDDTRERHPEVAVELEGWQDRISQQAAELRSLLAYLRAPELLVQHGLQLLPRYYHVCLHLVS